MFSFVFSEATFDFVNKPKTLLHLQAWYSCRRHGSPSFFKEQRVPRPQGPTFPGNLGSGQGPPPPALPPRMLSTLPVWVLLPAGKGRGCKQPHLHYNCSCGSLVLCRDPRNYLLTVDSKVRLHMPSQAAHAHGRCGSPLSALHPRSGHVPQPPGLLWEQSPGTKVLLSLPEDRGPRP